MSLHRSIQAGGRSGYLLLATCSGDEDTGGGLCVFDGQTVEVIDRVSSAGLRVAGDRMIRLLRTPLATGGGEFLVYDARGVRQYLRVDELSDGHYFAWDGRNIVAASTGSNSILWIAPSGEVERVWRAPGEDDSWHLNEVVLHEGRLYACAFGKYANYRGYKGNERNGHGHVFDLETGTRVAEGLCAPHSPRFFDGCWSVCDSAMCSVIQFERGGRAPRRTTQLNGFTRGMAVNDEYVFVGESAPRSDRGLVQGGSIAILSRESFEFVARVQLPFQEVFDLELAPAELVGGTRIGFRTNPLRVREQDQIFLFHQLGIEPQRLWATSDPLPPEHCRVSVDAAIPEAFEARRLTLIDCSVENRSERFYFPSASNPVWISYKWQLTERSTAMSHQEGLRTPLPCVLPPGVSVKVRMEVLPPPVAGEFRLTVTLVQDGVCWFDEIDPANGCSACVTVHAPQAIPDAGGSQDGAQSALTNATLAE